MKNTIITKTFADFKDEYEVIFLFMIALDKKC